MLETDELKELKNEIIEGRNLIIKTDNLVTNLGADIRKISKRQHQYERRFFFNSVFAYILFVIIIFTGLYLAFEARVAKEHTKVEAHIRELVLLKERLALLEEELEQRKQAEQTAYDFFVLVQQDRKDDVLDRYPEIQGKIINRSEAMLLRQSFDEIKRSLAEEAFHFALKAYQKKQYGTARDGFIKSLHHVARAPYTPSLWLHLGFSLYELKDYEGAIKYLELSKNETVSRKDEPLLLYNLGSAYEQTGRMDPAKKTYKYLRSKYPYDPLSNKAYKRVQRIEKNQEKERKAIERKQKKEDSAKEKQ